jgi:Holliday junction DNA helicase RuvA
LIGRLRGEPVAQEGDGTMVLDVGGVGYELVTPIGTGGRALREGGQLVLWVHTHVREDALQLFGFASADERTAFRTLIAISKVGPKLALAVLSALSVDELAELVARGTVGRLTAVPGIGKKTAERMLLELEGKLKTPVAAAAAGHSPPAAAADGQAALLCEALVRMGFKPPQAERAVAAMDDLDRPIGELIREALALLS